MAASKTLYDFSAKDIDGETVDLTKYKVSFVEVH